MSNDSLKELLPLSISAHYHFLSDDLWQKAHKVEKKTKEKILYTRKCEWCGKEFSTEISKQKYCSHECRYEANKKQHRDAWAQKFIPSTHVYVPGRKEELERIYTVYSYWKITSYSVYICFLSQNQLSVASMKKSP